MKVNIVGLGKLGLPMACVFASRHFEVLGVDMNEESIAKLQKGICTVKETDLAELLFKVGDDIEFTSDFSKVGEACATFIIVPTPSGSDNRFVNDYVEDALNNVCAVLEGNSAYHLIVIVSTVMPGSMDKVFKPIVERYGRIVGEDTGLCYNPEFIALGSVIDDMLNPDAVLIGESDKFAGNMLVGIYDRICGKDVPCRRMSWYNAEVAKLLLNVCITNKISLANTIAEICEKIPGGNVDDVTGFIGLDSRIGGKYLRGGLGFGGPCFPRDARAFKRVAEEYRTYDCIADAVDEFNQHHRNFVVNRIQDAIGDLKDKVVAVLGVTYKPDSPVVEDSEALRIVETLSQVYNAEVRVYDPEGSHNAMDELDDDAVIFCKNIEVAIDGADICILATPWNEFRNIKPDVFTKYMKTPKVYDCWRIYDSKDMKDAGIDYYALGVNKS